MPLVIGLCCGFVIGVIIGIAVIVLLFEERKDE